MKQNLNKINYKDLAKELNKINLINDNLLINTQLTINLNWMSTVDRMSMQYDIDLIASQIIVYLTYTTKNKNKNFKFTNFYDKKIILLLKNLIKDTDKFNKLLEIIQIDCSYFLKILSYIAPSVFTSKIIKFIHLNYFNIKSE